MTFSPVPKPTKAEQKPRKPVKTVNRKRKATEFIRCYHSEARVEFVRNLPCVVCGAIFCENSHITNGGAGRKGAYRKIVPLCFNMYAPQDGCYREGHHAESHRIGIKSFAAKYHLDLPALAEETERAWQASQVVSL